MTSSRHISRKSDSITNQTTSSSHQALKNNSNSPILFQIPIYNLKTTNHRAREIVDSMASVSMAVMVVPVTGGLNKQSTSIFNPLQKTSPIGAGGRKFSKLQVKASLKEKAIVAATSAAVTASMVLPQVAEAAEGSPSLKNFLLSIVSGGVVLTAIIGAVVGVSYFDPVKRG